MKDHQFEISLSLFTFFGWGVLFSVLFQILVGVLTAVASATAVYFATSYLKRRYPDGRLNLRWPWKK
ncbi:hypothetical protein BWI96_16700 [Siphonobacter sp. SORGH_AS_0500]|uniref:hypothetical protein n=1 Tax=Siphonobacter sp. SORGH_AS_0500 TaxID=1864824 RepID=UPI000CA772F0|nr:hypothetical protein [Siphonobacter sp. SORGH_AS_0500]PKK35538.1 hypothetical protein BWI96_16700 [Siphonobacter sp. SORGH_AS_0500]